MHKLDGEQGQLFVETAMFLRLRCRILHCKRQVALRDPPRLEPSFLWTIEGEFLNSGTGERDVYAYANSIETRLNDKSARLECVKRRIKTATESRRIRASEQLLNAQQQADGCVENLRARIAELRSAEHNSSGALLFEVDMAWEDLCQAIRKIVARCP